MKKKLTTVPKIVICFALIVIAVYGLNYYYQYKMADRLYKAIFLDNDQVYFGKIKNTFGKYVTITDVYYFGKGLSANSGQADKGDIVLIKLGTEVHRPTDEMKILESHILYIEKLSADSRVVAAIKEHKNK